MTEKKQENDTKKPSLGKTEASQPQTPGVDGASAKSAQTTTTRPASGGKGVAVLALLIALGAGAGSGYLWYLWDMEKRVQSSQSAELDARLQKALTGVAQERDAELKVVKDQLASQKANAQQLASGTQALNDHLQTLQGAVQSLQGSLQSVQNDAEIQKGDAQIRKSQVQALQDQVQAIQSNFQGLNDQFTAYTKEQQRNLAQLDTRMENIQLAERSLLTTLENIRAVVARGGDVNALPLSEVEYLLRMADHKLKLQRDLAGAIESLQTAEQRLKGVDENAFLGVQRMIAENIASLKGVDLPDRSALAHKIVEMERRVDGLPLRNEAELAKLREKVRPNIGQVGDLSEPSEASWWGRLGSAAWVQLKDIVVVRHERSDAPPLITMPEEYFLVQNLRLELEAMKLAVLNNDPGSFQESNETARKWLQTYFNTDDAGVSELLAELKALQAVQFNPYIPDIGGTLRAFRDVMERRQPVRSVVPSARTDDAGHGQSQIQETPQ